MAPQRRPLRADFVLPIDAPGATPAPPPWVRVPGMGPARAVSPATSSLTRVLDEVWTSEGGGRGGRPLDEALTNLGDPYIENERVVWDPPADLDPAYSDYLSESVAELNRLMDRGVVEIDAEGNIKPVESGGGAGATTPTRGGE
jgi:hypothetical protein